MVNKGLTSSWLGSENGDTEKVGKFWGQKERQKQHNGWETLGMQVKGHGVTITGSQGQQEEDRFM